MTYSRACELLGLTTPKSLERNARLASSMLDCMCDATPLRKYVAADIIINYKENIDKIINCENIA